MATQDVQGLRELDRKLKQLPGRVRRKVLNGALREAAKPIHEDARGNMPKDSGKTKKDLKVRTYPKSKTPRKLGDAAVAIAGSAAKGGRDHIMRFLEFGTEKMAPKPFMRPAADANAGSSIQVFGKAAWKRLKREMQKLR